MGVFTIVGILVALIIIGLVIWRVTSTSTSSDPGTVRIVPGSMSGKTQRNAPGALPRSFNQSEGATFTYTGWLLFNDFTFNYGQKRLIFSKGDCPGMYLDSTSNGILVVVNTYGSPESILISNLPARKWIHFGVVVDQDSVDIYINGLIRQHHTLAQLPKQNDKSVALGSSTVGWDGVLSNLQYTPRSLSAGEVAALIGNVPKDDLTIPPSGPQYYDLTWYIGRT